MNKQEQKFAEKFRPLVDEANAYFNTTNLEGSELKTVTQKAFSQEQVIMAIYRSARIKTMTPSEVYQTYLERTRLLKTPITSIRRAMTCLTKSGHLIKTEHKREGMYGSPEHYYRLA